MQLQRGSAAGHCTRGPEAATDLLTELHRNIYLHEPGVIVKSTNAKEAGNPHYRRQSNTLTNAAHAPFLSSILTFTFLGWNTLLLYPRVSDDGSFNTQTPA